MSERISYSEQDIEDWIYDNPESVGVYEWLGRQIKLPSGILDLAGYDITNSYNILLIELKSRKPKSEDLAQVSRYAADLLRALPPTMTVEKQLIAVCGESIDNQLLMEANALDVKIRSVSVSVSLEISWHYSFTEEAEKRIENEIAQLKLSEPFKELHEIFEGQMENLEAQKRSK